MLDMPFFDNEMDQQFPSHLLQKGDNGNIGSLSPRGRFDPVGEVQALEGEARLLSGEQHALPCLSFLEVPAAGRSRIRLYQTKRAVP
jgi:hypothetical protein